MNWSRIAGLIGIGMVLASHSSACEIAASPMIFGDYIPMDPAPLRATGRIEVMCPAGVRYRVSALDGNSASASLPRRLTHFSGSDTLSYNLYIDPLGQQIWGDGTRGTSIVTGDGNGLGNTHFVHGLIFPNQRVASGQYSDVVRIYVEW